jgi:hypothetical protein
LPGVLYPSVSARPGGVSCAALQYLALPDGDVAWLRRRPRMPVPAGHPGCSLRYLKGVRASVARPGARGPAGGRDSRPLVPWPGACCQARWALVPAVDLARCEHLTLP